MKTSLNTILTPLALALGITAVGAAYAQYTGPTDRPTLTTVEAALASKQDDQPVALTGRLIRQIDEENFIFADDTGEIHVEIDDDRIAGLQLDETTQVELVGEVETRRMRANEVEVDRIRLVTQ
jgi:uncharacterized protein (TIGR00156 family)